MSTGNVLTLDEADRIVGDVLRATAQQLGRDRISDGESGAKEIMETVEALSGTKFSEARNNFLDFEVTEEGDGAHAFGRGPFGPFMLSAFRKYICNDPAAAEKIEQAAREAKKLKLDLGIPTGTGIAVGGAGIVMLAVSSVIPVALVAIAAPLVGAISLVVLLSGLDGFCAWSAPETSVQTREKPDAQA